MMTGGILADGLAFPEGPVFDAFGHLWVTEMAAGCITCIYRDGSTARFAVGGKPNGLAIDRDGHIWICNAELNQLQKFDPDACTVTTELSEIAGHNLSRPNDLIFDAVGTLLFSCSGYEGDVLSGTCCCLQASGQASVFAEGLAFPNGLAIDEEVSDLVVAETRTGRLWRGRWNADDQAWEAPHIFYDIGVLGRPGGPDGLVIASDGTIYLAVYGSASLHVISRGGKSLGRVHLTGFNPTNCTFDFRGNLGLVVTEAELGQVLSYSHLNKQGPLRTAAQAARPTQNSELGAVESRPS